MRALLILSLVLAGILLAAACSNTEPVPTATPTVTLTPVPTPTPAPTATPEPTPTPGPTARPTRTPEPPDVLFDYTAAVQLLSAGMYEEAIPRFSLVLRVLPEFAQAYHGRGLAYAHEEHLDLAVEDFDSAIRFKDDFGDAYRNRGVVLGQLGRNDEAVSDLERAVVLFTEDGRIADAQEARLHLVALRN